MSQVGNINSYNVSKNLPKAVTFGVKKYTPPTKATRDTFVRGAKIAEDVDLKSVLKASLALATATVGAFAMLKNPSRAISEASETLADTGIKSIAKIADNIKEPLMTPKLEALYSQCIEELGGISQKIQRTLDSLDLSKAPDKKISEIASSIKPDGSVEEVLGLRMTLLRYLFNNHNSTFDPAALNLDEFSKSIRDINVKYSKSLNERFSSLLIADINKGLPDVDSLVSELAKKYNIEEKDCANLVEKITRFSGFDDFRELGRHIGNRVLLTTDEVGFDQASSYIMRDKLKCVQKMQNIADFSELTKIDPKKQYTILLDDAKLKALEGVELPDNIKGIYVGDIAHNNNIYTSFSTDSIEKRFAQMLDSKAQEPNLPKGVVSYDELSGSENIIDVLRQRFVTKVKPEGFDYGSLPYSKGGLTLDETRSLTQSRYDLLQVLNDEDITKGLKILGQNVEDYAQKSGIKGPVQYAIQAPSRGFDTKSQHLLAYKMKCLNPDISFAYMKKTPEGIILDASDAAKLVAYVDDYSGSGESLQKVAKAIMDQGDRQYVVAPLVCAPQTVKKLSGEFASTNTTIFEPIFKVKNSGIVNAPEVSTLEQLKAALDEGTSNYIRIDELAKSIEKGKIDLSKNPLEGLYTYEVYQGRLSEIYASKIPPAIALDSVTGYRGSGTAVLLPYMSPNTNTRNMNLIFKDTLKKVNRNIIKSSENYKIKPADIIPKAS